MSTIMWWDETLPAEKLSTADSQKSIDQLMEYDRRLQEPFTKEELQKLYSREGRFSIISLLWAGWHYGALTEAEKHILDELGLTPEKVSNHPFCDNISDQRRALKSYIIAPPKFDEYNSKVAEAAGIPWHTSTSNETGKIRVWFDSEEGFYYIRWQRTETSVISTAYQHPVLIVQKNKLRPDQIEYLDRKSEERTNRRKSI